MAVNLEKAAVPAPQWAALRLWLLAPALGLAFVGLAAWLQRGFWLNSCPGQIGADCDGRWFDLHRVFFAETILCLAACAVAAFAVHSVGMNLSGQAVHREKQARRLAVFACALALAGPLLTAWFVLHRFANSGDEYSYIFQARTFAGLRLWENPPALGVDLIPNRTFIFDGKWISQYPPGWAFVLAAGSRLGLPPWTINPLIGAASVAALALFCRRVAASWTSALAVLLYAATPFYVLNAASYFPHVFSSLLVLLLCLCLQGDEGGKTRLLAAGACLGALAATRYFDVLALIPALSMWLRTAKPADWPRRIGLLAAGFAPFVALLGLYQAVLLGSPFRSTYSVINSPDTFLSLDPSLLAISPLVAAVRLGELALWTSPLLLLAYFASLAAKWKTRSFAFYDLIFPSFVIAYLAFANFGGNRYGPRYYLDAFPLAVATIASASPSLAARAPRAFARLAPIGVAVFVLYLVAVWPLAAAGFSRQIWARQEPFRLAAEAGLANAIVIEDTTGGPGLVLPDLVRNPPSMDAPVLYARAGADVGAIREAFPERSIWRYSRADPAKPGRLIRLPPP
ncbi:MAG TPA: hypothetical protein VKU03_15350 [Roseiarcus sp.]|nr:hypothetical protein [Roseiarcus sp.]